jgi:cytochrome c553
MLAQGRKGRWALLTALFICCAGAQERLPLCLSCHGQDGNSVTPGIPSIAGQPGTYIETQLILFREGVRTSEQMQPAVKGLTDADILRFAKHFSELPPKSMEAGAADSGLMKRGMEQARALRCGSCHMPDYRGQAQIPRLAGQREDYLAAEMIAYRDNKRSGGDTIMAATLYGVSDADIKALAHFLSRSKP